VGIGPSTVLTDIFATSTKGGTYNRLSGKEQKISESGGLAGILQNATAAPIAGQSAAPPLTTRAEALKLVQLYLDGVRAANPKAAAQLRSSSPRIVDLVYIPCTIPGPTPIPWLGPLSPRSVGDPQAIQNFVA